MTFKQIKSGPPLLIVPIAGTQATTIMASYGAGSRVERPEENGVAHFLEHLVFKGGESFPDYRAINYRADEIGAQINAYTSKDIVSFHLTLHGDVVNEGLDLLTDFVGRPTIPEGELETERGVVIQEIGRADDDPSTVAYRVLDQAVYGDAALGRRILGTREIISSISRKAIFKFRARTWSAGRGCLLVIGNTTSVSSERLEELARRLPAPTGELEFDPAPDAVGRRLVKQTDSKQSHLRMAWRPDGVDPLDERQRAALHIYNELLGGMTSSRLFDEIREQRGLCYSVGSYNSFYCDDHRLNVAAGLQPDRLEEAMTRITEIVGELATGGPTDEEIERARASRLGAQSRAFESSNTVARTLANSYVVYGQVRRPDELIAVTEAVTAKEVREVAELVSGDPAIALVGPHDPDDFDAEAAEDEK